METRTVLIIDDSSIDRLLITEYLRTIKDCNYSFIEASSAEVGLQILDEIIPDAILLDNMMEDVGMNGVDAVPFIKKTRNKFTPIIMITSNPLESIRKQAMEAGVAHFMDKLALVPQVLHETITKYMQLNTELRAMTA
ncbi:MAG: hypothetical protein COV36_03225 [Alphaproteobacteria bacterium CG11_big_fil_rev_8_21_14_0_20_44_7]|nr:MAG: hypothetical protein COV36_03225 [Alphaproteobacteria bacterium CG11_big_fil_rev_8_21_14_0_20_44_7]